MNSPGRSHQQQWNASLYDDQFAFVSKFGAGVVDWLAPKPGERILDVGCGTGTLSAKLAESGAEVVGVDSSPEMIEQARQAYPRVKFEVMDARSLTFDGQFDAVFSNAALHWVREADAAAKGMARALKPGGRLVAELGGKGNVSAIESAVNSVLARLGEPPVPSPWYFPSIAEYAAVLERAGLEPADATLFDRLTPLEGDDAPQRWIEMFGGHVKERVPAAKRDAFYAGLIETLRPRFCRDGQWFADYRRLRVRAIKRGG